MDALLPNLEGRRRLDLIETDLADLSVKTLAFDTAPAFAIGAAVDLPAALGWLYAAEGSNMGAAFMLKWAKEKLGLSEEFGAGHLAGAPEVRGLHGHSFTASLDEVALSDDNEACVIAGAETAFRRVQALLDEAFG